MGGERPRAARGCLRQRPVPTPAPVRPGTAASSAVVPAVPGPAPGAPRPPGSRCARDTQGGGGVVLPWPDPPHPLHTPVFSRECVWCLVIAPRRLSPCLSVCPPTRLLVPHPLHLPASFTGLSFRPSPCRGSWQLLGEASLLTVSITGTGQRDAGGPRTTTGPLPASPPPAPQAFSRAPRSLCVCVARVHTHGRVCGYIKGSHHRPMYHALLP